jgi:hypothetical protein
MVLVEGRQEAAAVARVRAGRRRRDGIILFLCCLQLQACVHCCGVFGVW